MAISMLKIRRPLGRLIFNMGIAIPGKTVFLIETAPWFYYEYYTYVQVEHAPRFVVFCFVVCILYIHLDNYCLSSRLFLGCFSGTGATIWPPVSLKESEKYIKSAATISQQNTTHIYSWVEIILGKDSANERRRYYVTSSLIG